MVKNPKCVTPVMKQFWEAKKAHPNTLILFRMGDFYETFEKDAIIASEVLGIVLTKRANGAASTVPLAGFPHHSLEQYLHKLLRAGHRVAICEQVEDPKLAKGIVKREVVEVVTPGTALSEKFLDNRENNYLASVVFLKDYIGLSIIDHSTGEFITGEWEKESLSDILKQFLPSEILVPETQEQTLNSLLKGHQYFITTFPEWVSDYSSAYELLTEHFSVQNLKGFGVEEMPLSVSSAGAGLYYISQNSMGKTHHITSLSVILDEGIMGLDSATVRNLEIFNSLSNQGIHGTLISVIDQCITSMGSRLLKGRLRRPITVESKINERLDRVEEFINNESLATQFRKKLKGVSDLHRILARLSTNRVTPREIVHLKQSLSVLPVFQAALSKKEPVLKKLISEIKDTSSIEKKIDTTLKEDPPINITKGGYIRTGFSEDLDEYRKLSKDASSWLVKYQVDEQKRTGIPKLKVGYNKVFGYYIEITKTHQEKVPDNYIRKQTLTNAERYFTEELKDFESKILSAEDRIIEIEANIFQSLKEDILKSASYIQYNAGIIAQLDIASGLAVVAIKNHYNRPEIVNDQSLTLKGSRHPVVEELLHLGDQFIPNDLEMNVEDRQIAIITGPNMAGKSTYLRQIGLTVLLAQIGSFIPAESGKIGIVDKLFTRVGASDNLAGGESTFLVEMNETANILNNTTKNSLILLDEIGRGTSTFDGLSIAWAVTEYIHNNEKVSAKTLFATHYHELVELANQLPRAYNLNVAVKEFGNRIVFLRKIIEGGADKSYGIHVAEMAGLPKQVIHRSDEILSQLMGKDANTIEVSQEVRNISQTDLFEKLESELIEELGKLEIDKITPVEALNTLNEIKKKHGI